MMAGAVGALLCTAAGTALGMALRERWLARLSLVEQTQDMLARLRLMLTQERMGMCEVLGECAGEGKDGMPARFIETARLIRSEPLMDLHAAYAQAAEKIRVAGESKAEKKVVEQLFSEMGVGTAAMREQAVAACLRRLKPIAQEAARKAELGSRLCVQLGLLGGVMLGIVLW